MNNRIKILSVLVLLLFAGSFAMPFFAQENCDMPKSSSTALHCDMEMSGMDCCEAVTECVTVPMLPLVTAPINKVELQKDITLDYIVSFTMNFELFEDFSFIQVSDKLCSHENHPGFQTPLLV